MFRRYQNPLQQGTDVLPNAMQPPPVVRFEGVQAGSPRARELMGRYYSFIAGFLRAQRQNQAAGGLPQVSVTRDFPEISVTYRREFGQEYFIVRPRPGGLVRPEPSPIQFGVITIVSGFSGVDISNTNYTVTHQIRVNGITVLSPTPKSVYSFSNANIGFVLVPENFDRATWRDTYRLPGPAPAVNAAGAMPIPDSELDFFEAQYDLALSLPIQEIYDAANGYIYAEIRIIRPRDRVMNFTGRNEIFSSVTSSATAAATTMSCSVGTGTIDGSYTPNGDLPGGGSLARWLYGHPSVPRNTYMAFGGNGTTSVSSGGAAPSAAKTTILDFGARASRDAGQVSFGYDTYIVDLNG